MQSQVDVLCDYSPKNGAAHLDPLFLKELHEEYQYDTEANAFHQVSEQVFRTVYRRTVKSHVAIRAKKDVNGECKWCS